MYWVTSNDFRYVLWYSNSIGWFGSIIFSSNKKSVIFTKYLITSLLFVIAFVENCLQNIVRSYPVMG